ncbi:hypothetical protein ACMYUJ_17675 [Stutzerimonas zhaodongensis]|uniref:hypothetical protein n=1 Tax=Stutzerimonas zhaodongensis TaxID=1176257 RepID=UPI0039EF40D2
MSPKLPPKKAALYDRRDEILWFDWDPIGCNEYEAARDEYHSYLPHVFSLAIGGNDTYKISSFLHECETINMGLAGNKKRCDAVAVLICSERDKTYP